MEEALFSILTGNAPIAARIDDRVYPIERPQGSKLDAITFQRAGGLRDYDMEGATGLVESRFLIWCWAEKKRGESAYRRAKYLARLVRDAFCPSGGFRQTVGTTEIQGIFINNEDDSRADGATGTGAVGVLLDCTFWHTETEVS